MLPERGAPLRGLDRTTFTEQLRAWGGTAKFGETLARHTTIGVGGQAACYCLPESPQELAELIGLCRRYNWPYLLFGAGSNLLFSDRGYPGVVFSTERLRGIFFEQDSVRVLAGERLVSVLDAVTRVGASSLNFLTGIPGSLGGAIAMNAGSHSRSIGDLVTEVAIVDNGGGMRILQQEDCQFVYRQSAILGQGLPVLWARLRLDGESYDREEMLAQRLASQPVSVRSAGCVFKNPSGVSAGQLIDEARLKGLQVGMAKVSEKHANFILNLGGATSAEIRKLIDIVRQKVYKSFRVLLELEIEVIDG